jgi:hypothetical protein
MMVFKIASLLVGSELRLGCLVQILGNALGMFLI